MMSLSMALAAFIGTCLHASEFVAFAGLVSGFTVPILCVPIWDAHNKALDRGTARLVQSATGAVCLLFARVLVPPPRALSLLKIRMVSSLRGICIAVQELAWRDDVDSEGPRGCRRLPIDESWTLRQERLVPELSEQRCLFEEALEEPFVINGPSPVDLRRVIEAIRGMWQCVLQIESMLASFGRSGLADALLERSRDRSIELMQCVLDAADHMGETLTGAGTKLPASLFRLLHCARALDSSSLEQLNIGCDDEGGGMHEERTHDVIALGALLGRLQLLSEHTAEMAWRTVALIQKERPSAKSDSSNLYDFEITI